MKKRLNALDILKISTRAEGEWIKHLHQMGVDTSGYPEADVPIPELGIVHHRVYFPNALKPQFEQWFSKEFLPRFLRGEVKP